MKKAGLAANITLAVATLLPLGLQSGPTAADERPADKIEQKDKHHRVIQRVLEKQRAEYGQVLDVGTGRDPASVYGQDVYGAATKGSYKFFVTCADERVKPDPNQFVKIGDAGTRASEQTIKALKDNYATHFVAWHDGCAANKNKNEESQLQARRFAFGIGLPMENVKSFGSKKKGHDEDMDFVPEDDHLHPASVIWVNAIPEKLNQGLLHKNLYSFVVSQLKGQDPKEVRDQAELLTHVGMKSISPDARRAAKMPLIIMASGSATDPTKSYTLVLQNLDSMKDGIEKKYGKDAVRYVGFNVK